MCKHRDDRAVKLAHASIKNTLTPHGHVNVTTQVKGSGRVQSGQPSIEVSGNLPEPLALRMNRACRGVHGVTSSLSGGYINMVGPPNVLQGLVGQAVRRYRASQAASPTRQDAADPVEA